MEYLTDYQEDLAQLMKTAIRKVIAQGKRSYIKGYCLYRGPEGTKCAIGHLIPDELYTRDIEGKNIYAALTDLKIQLPAKIRRELGRLQWCHDVCKLPDTFVEDFTARVKNNLPKEYWPDEL